MSEKFVPNIFIINFPDEQQKICEDCLATGESFNGPLAEKSLICKPARLENILKRKPTCGETEGEKINMSSIPEDCPNGYKSVSVRKIR